MILALIAAGTLLLPLRSEASKSYNVNRYASIPAVQSLLQSFSGNQIYVRNWLSRYRIGPGVGPKNFKQATYPLGQALSWNSSNVYKRDRQSNLYTGTGASNRGYILLIADLKKHQAYLSAFATYGGKGFVAPGVNIRYVPNVLAVFYKEKKYLAYLPRLEASFSRNIRSALGTGNFMPDNYQVRIYNLNRWRTCKITDGHRMLDNCPHKTLVVQVKKKSESIPSAAKASAMTVLKQFFVETSALPGINTGPADSKKRMVIVFDANCPMCARQWVALKPYFSQVRIHWVPIADFSATSAQLGGALLAARNPAATLAYNEAHYDFKADAGGYLIPYHVPKRYVEEVKQNTESAVIKKNVMGTPAVGLELVPGKKYFFIPGMITSQRMAKILPLLGQEGS